MKTIVLSTLVVLLFAGCVGTAKLAKENTAHNLEQIQVTKPSIQRIAPNHKD